MNISISSLVFDINGLLQLTYDEGSDADNLQRRVNKTASLDGGATYSDQGFAWADSDLRLLFSSVTEAEHEQLKRLIQDYGEILVSFKAGVFKALLERVTRQQGETELSVLLLEKVSA